MAAAGAIDPETQELTGSLGVRFPGLRLPLATHRWKGVSRTKNVTRHPSSLVIYMDGRAAIAGPQVVPWHVPRRYFVSIECSQIDHAFA
jgi:hypothetical protein